MPACVLFLILKEKLWTFAIKYDVSSGLVMYDIYNVEVFLLYSICLEFVMKRCCIFVIIAINFS